MEDNNLEVERSKLGPPRVWITFGMQEPIAVPLELVPELIAKLRNVAKPDHITTRATRADQAE